MIRGAATAIVRARAGVGGGLGPRFWRLWSASATSNLSDGIFRVALPLLAISLTDSPALVAGVTIASGLPWLVFALVAGALADRLDRRRTMVAVQVGRVVLLGGLAAAVLGGFASIVLVYVVALGMGILETLFDTSAQSILPNVVTRDRLTTANGRLHVAEQTLNEFIGPPIGGLLAAIGLGVTFGASAAGYLGAALILMSLSGTFLAERQGPSTRIHREIAEGLAYVLRHRLLRTLALVVAGLNMANGAAWSIFVLYAVRPGPMGLSEVGFGTLLAVSAVGSVAGTLVAPTIERRIGRQGILTGAVVIYAAQYAVLAITPQPVAVAIALAVAFGAVSAFNVVFISLRQRIVPNELLGRLVASSRMVGWGTLPLGALLGGLIGTAFGLPAVFAFAALLSISLLPARFIFTDGAIDAAERAAAEEAGRSTP